MNPVSPPISFELTQSEIIGRMQLRHARMQQSWPRRLCATLFLFNSILFASQGNLWLFVVTFVIFSENWQGWLSYGLGRLFASRSTRGPFQVEYDERCIFLRCPNQAVSPQRYWWRSLKAVRENDGWLSLDFGSGILLEFPTRAFATTSQQAQFLAFVHSRLPAGHKVAAAG